MAALVALAGFAIWSYAEGGIVATMLGGELSAGQKLERLREFFSMLGAWAPAAYVALVTVEVVVAPIPGTVLYAPGGAIFGGFWGGTLSLLGNILGAGIAFLAMRALGHAAFERFVGREHLERYETHLTDNGVLVVFLLRVNPLTSSDLVSYAAGLTSMPLWKLAAGTTLGMAPLCYLQSYLAQGLLSAYPRLIYPLFVAGFAYVVVFVVVIRRMIARDRSRG